VRTVEDTANDRWLQPICVLQRGLTVGVIAVCLVPATTAGQGITSASVRGRVVASDGAPVEGALVD
jgi:hypothetical protein